MIARLTMWKRDAGFLLKREKNECKRFVTDERKLILLCYCLKDDKEVPEFGNHNL